MRKLLTANFSRLWRSKIFWVLEALSAIAGAVFYILAIINTKNIGENWYLWNTAHNLNTVTVGRLFDRFYTVEASRNSTGLGLSIAKLLIECMGGSIEASYKNKKLTIHVRL